MKSSEKFYNQLTILYPVVDILLRPQKRKFFREISSLAHGRLLEIGVGTGTHFKYYDRHEITGIDTSQRMLDEAEKHLKSNIRLELMNGETLLFPEETFDYVILSHVIAVVQDPNNLLKEIHRVLKPNGKVLILNHFTPNNWLKFVDLAAQWLSRHLYFRSVFHLSVFPQIKSFKLLREVNAGFFSYFKIVIYEKSV